jgi:hypothetical protein
MTLIKILIFLSLLSMMARIFLQDSIDSPKRSLLLIFMGIFRGGFGVSSLIPIKVKGNPKERKKIILANVFLLLFYFFASSMFIALIILSY